MSALGIIGDNAQMAAPAVAAFLESNTNELDGSGTIGIVEALGQCGKNSPEAARAVAAEFPCFAGSAGPALRLIGRPAIDPLAKWLEHDRADVRLAVVKTLAEFDDDAEHIRGSLIQATRDSDFTVREAALLALGQKQQTSPEVLATLLVALRDHRMPVRAAAAKSLGAFELEARRVVPALVAALGDEYLGVRACACRALSGFGHSASDAVAALERIATTDEFELGRVVARDALQNIRQAAK